MQLLDLRNDRVCEVAGTIARREAHSGLLISPPPSNRTQRDRMFERRYVGFAAMRSSGVFTCLTDPSAPRWSSTSGPVRTFIT